MDNAMRIHRNAGNNHHYTPPEVIRAAKVAMGGIDLDPASCAAANESLVKAPVWYGEEEDGVAQEWRGRVWLNPPYARGLIEAFVGKLLGEIDAGRVLHACLLTHNNTETKWCNEILSRANAVCFVQRRLRFYEPDGNGGVYCPEGAPLQGQIVTYFGDRRDEFRLAFGERGFGVGHCMINNLPEAERIISTGRRAFMAARAVGQRPEGRPKTTSETAEKPTSDVVFSSSASSERALALLRSPWARELEDAVDNGTLSLDGAYKEMRRRGNGEGKPPA